MFACTSNGKDENINFIMWYLAFCQLCYAILEIINHVSDMNLIMAKVGHWDGPPLIVTELSHQLCCLVQGRQCTVFFQCFYPKKRCLLLLETMFRTWEKVERIIQCSWVCGTRAQDPLLNCLEWSQLKWFRHLISLPLIRHLPLEFFLGTEGRSQCSTRWGDYISHLAWEHLRVLHKEL